MLDWQTHKREQPHNSLIGSVELSSAESLLSGRAVSLLGGSDEPLYRQIYERFRRAIANGTYTPGMRVPSVRNLASELQISRGTVEMAYDLLIGDGYLVARGQAGTVVSPSLAAGQVHDSLARATEARAVGRSTDHGAQATPHPFQVGLPALDQFPHKLWATLVSGRRACKPSISRIPIRQATSRYVKPSRRICRFPAGWIANRSRCLSCPAIAAP